ncbi:hypothetical protein [Mycobacterium shimoidei]|uniref:Secreted protein n=1 Tax=Mycobacterium shimoidei TaxID=29313 RepID=A0A1E3TE68_MYCSH|nr:hypothetical protein [Mycobacterium shimoidei]MCV7258393.1 hypothetical protein [Mycobacterium shimoidei]ODR12644.1 hypothetical protein BHQ16_14190 [Mycobacterium shimoidei]ORW81750.1 hypothetical protein AWC26_06790 [Mycobacterium shimoidei]SRX93736.1 hypothetical protein MSP7336_01979 [Mycobacterium shimoidei]
MRRVGMAAAATVLAASGCLVAGSPVAVASRDNLALNGTYRATSIGQWAKTNDTYHDEATVVSTWTITSTCSNAQQCTGTVTSDQGWSAPLNMSDGTLWKVAHDVPGWEKCPDGSSYPGHQLYSFWPVDDAGMVQVGSPTLGGFDKTTGPSGACGRNYWLVIEMPFRLEKIG